jgi:hypothetical protein
MRIGPPGSPAPWEPAATIPVPDLPTEPYWDVPRSTADPDRHPACFHHPLDDRVAGEAPHRVGRERDAQLCFRASIGGAQNGDVRVHDDHRLPGFIRSGGHEPDQSVRQAGALTVSRVVLDRDMLGRPLQRRLECGSLFLRQLACTCSARDRRPNPSRRTGDSRRQRPRCVFVVDGGGILPRARPATSPARDVPRPRPRRTARNESTA